jgi:DHA3 family macrolide efflux protein-like MFS transporter
MDSETQSYLPDGWAPRFFTVWGGQVFSLFGSALVQFALVWYLTQQTGSATVLAAATLAALLPQIVLGPFVGALVDRWNRRIVMILADGFIALVTLGLVILFAIGKIQIWHIYVVVALRSLGGAFQSPAMQASTSLMVPDKHLSRVAGMNQTLQGAINIIAPPTGALLMTTLPMQGILFIDITTAILAISPLFFIPIPQPVRMNGDKPMAEAEKSNFLQDVRAGLAYVGAWPGLMAILIMATMINFLLTPAGSLMPLLVTKHFGLGALQFGVMDSVWGFGVIAGGLILSIWGGFKSKIVTSLCGIIGIGLGILLVGMAPSNLFALALVGYLISGFTNPIANGPLFALIQSTVRPDMQGRVMSLIMSAAMAMSPLSLLVAGPISDWLGIRIWFWIGGSLTLLMGAGAFFVPAILNVEKNRNSEGLEMAEAQSGTLARGTVLK